MKGQWLSQTKKTSNNLDLWKTVRFYDFAKRTR